MRYINIYLRYLLLINFVVFVNIYIKSLKGYLIFLNESKFKAITFRKLNRNFLLKFFYVYKNKEEEKKRINITKFIP